MIQLGHVEVYPPSVEGESCVYKSSPFILTKKKWVPDVEVVDCLLCQQKFSKIRRKHHCRQCGKVLCNKCCDSKILIPQLSYSDEPQRVCDRCLPYTQAVAKARLSQFSKKEESCKYLCDMVKDKNNISMVIETGGVQTLIFLSQSINSKIKAITAEGLHILATYPSLHDYLVQAGIIKAIASFLNTCEEQNECAFVDMLSALMLLVKSNKNKAIAISEGILVPVLKVCGMKETIGLLAVSVLSLLANHKDCVIELIEKDKVALSQIISMVNASDEKMQEISLKILALLSLGTDWQRHRIMQENFSCKNALTNVLKKVPKNQQVLVNGICLIGNLATCEKDHMMIIDCFNAMCQLIVHHVTEINNDVKVQIARAFSNFSSVEDTARRVIPYIHNIVVLMQSDSKDTQRYCLKTFVNLMKFFKGSLLERLVVSDYEKLFSVMMDEEYLLETMNRCLEGNAPLLAKPITH